MKTAVSSLARSIFLEKARTRTKALVFRVSTLQKYPNPYEQKLGTSMIWRNKQNASKKHPTLTHLVEIRSAIDPFPPYHQAIMPYAWRWFWNRPISPYNLSIHRFHDPSFVQTPKAISNSQEYRNPTMQKKVSINKKTKKYQWITNALFKLITDRPS